MKLRNYEASKIIAKQHLLRQQEDTMANKLKKVRFCFLATQEASSG
jgi:hypothetical protein